MKIKIEYNYEANDPYTPCTAKVTLPGGEMLFGCAESWERSRARVIEKAKASLAEVPPSEEVEI